MYQSAFNNILVSALLLVSACEKSYDVAPVKNVAEAARINIAALRGMYREGLYYRFRSDSNLYALVTADESTGNFYREIFLQDATGGLNVRLLVSGGFAAGDSIRINLNNVVITAQNGLLLLDSLDAENNVVKLASGCRVTPLRTDISEFASVKIPSPLQSQLVEISGVEFGLTDKEKSLADGPLKKALTRTIQSCTGYSIGVRTSGYALFASAVTPKGSGSITAIVTQYNGNLQLAIRSPGDIRMPGATCTTSLTGKVYLRKDFSDESVGSGGWSSFNVTGSQQWACSKQGNGQNPYGMIRNFVGGSNVVCETWFVSPRMDLSSSSTPFLTFSNAFNYQGDPLEVLISKDFDGSDLTGAKWSTVNFQKSPGGFQFVSSGALSLADYREKSITIAFRYRGSDHDGSTWEIDDIIVKEGL